MKPDSLAFTSAQRHLPERHASLRKPVCSSEKDGCCYHLLLWLEKFATWHKNPSKAPESVYVRVPETCGPPSQVEPAPSRALAQSWRPTTYPCLLPTTSSSFSAVGRPSPLRVHPLFKGPEFSGRWPRPELQPAAALAASPRALAADRRVTVETEQDARSWGRGRGRGERRAETGRWGGALRRKVLGSLSVSQETKQVQAKKMLSLHLSINTMKHEF